MVSVNCVLPILFINSYNPICLDQGWVHFFDCRSHSVCIFGTLAGRIYENKVKILFYAVIDL